MHWPSIKVGFFDVKWRRKKFIIGKQATIDMANAKQNFKSIDLNADELITPNEFMLPFIYGLHEEESEMDAAFKV